MKLNTFGLASEQGVLYGVTPSEIYRINLSTSVPTFETILLNDFAHGQWWGAAGFSEAIEFVSTAHISEPDAENNVGALPNSWTNTNPGSQIIYIRTEELVVVIM